MHRRSFILWIRSLVYVLSVSVGPLCDAWVSSRSEPRFHLCLWVLQLSQAFCCTPDPLPSSVAGTQASIMGKQFICAWILSEGILSTQGKEPICQRHSDCGKLLIHTELYKNPFVKIPRRANTSPGKLSSRVLGCQEQPPSLGTNQKAGPERWQIWNSLADAFPGPPAQRRPFLLTQHWLWTHRELVLAVREKPMWKI